MESLQYTILGLFLCWTLIFLVVFLKKTLVATLLKGHRDGKYADIEKKNVYCKMTLCVRQDLGMGKGKIAAQCGHAVLGAYQKATMKNSPYLKAWEAYGEKKVALRVQDEDELLEIMKRARKHCLNTYIVCDAGKTQIPSGSYTVLAIGPDPELRIDSITGSLKLL